MSNYTGTNYSWSIEKSIIKQEPFADLILTECSPEQLKMKIEFLEKNNMLLRSECEILELSLVTLQPDLNNDIDTRWIPFFLNNQVYKPIRKFVKSVRYMSLSSLKSKRVYSGSLFTTVKKAMINKKISIHHLIHLTDQVLLILNKNCSDHYNMLSNFYENLETKIESLQFEYIRILLYIENYKKKIIEPGFHLLTKRIPSDRYLNFIKHNFFNNDNTINEYRLRIINIIKKKKNLENTFIEYQIIHKNVNNSKVYFLTKEHERLSQKEIHMTELNTKLESLKKNIRLNYFLRKYKLDNFERNLGLEILDAEINRFKKKTLVTITKNTDDDEPDQPIVPKRILDKQIDSYMKVKLYNLESDKKIKILENKHERQKQTLRIYRQTFAKD